MATRAEVESLRQELNAEKEGRRVEREEINGLFEVLHKGMDEMGDRLRVEMDQEDAKILSMSGTMAASVRMRNILFEFECLDIATQGMSHL